MLPKNGESSSEEPSPNEKFKSSQIRGNQIKPSICEFRISQAQKNLTRRSPDWPNYSQNLSRGPKDWKNSSNTSYLWGSDFKCTEPEHSEAFIEEPGIKLFQHSTLESSTRDNESDSEDLIDLNSEEEEDPLYHLEYIDDTIVEEKEDDEEGLEGEHDDSECKNNIDKERANTKNVELNFKLDKLITAKDVDMLNIADSSLKEAQTLHISAAAALPTIAVVEYTGTLSQTLAKLSNKNQDANYATKEREYSPVKKDLEKPESNSSFKSLETSPESRTSYVTPPSPSALPLPHLKWTHATINFDPKRKTFESNEIENRLIENVFVPIPSPIVTSSSVPQVFKKDKDRYPVFSLSDSVLAISKSSIMPQLSVASAVPVTSAPLFNSTTPPSTSQKPNSRPSSRPSSRSNSPIAVGLTGNMWAGLPNITSSPTVTKPNQSQPFVLSSGRGRGGRFNLPMARNGPRHKFVIRRVNESEAQAKRVATYADSRPADGSLRTGKAAASPIWLRKHPDLSQVNSTTAQNTQNSSEPEKESQVVILGATLRIDNSENLLDGDLGIPAPPHAAFRPRSGTWSMANSRKNKMKQEKENEAQTRQRRKSGDDVLNSKEKDKKKEASPGLLDSIRPRSKSDAARGKRPNLISTVKNAVQQSLSSQNSYWSGRRSGDATPTEVSGAPAQEVYHTWHAGSAAKTTIGRVWDLFRGRNESNEERQRRKSGGGKYEKDHLKRRASMDSDRKRHSSGAFGQTYFRGEDPNQAAIVFRDCRGLPVTAPFLENIRRSDLESDESQIMVKFFKHHTTYDLIPTSAKLVIFDTKLQVKKAFYALVYNGVRAAPLWDSQRQKFVGMLTITDFIRILQSFYNCGNREMEELEEHRLELWRTLLKDDVRDLIYIRPTDSLYDAIESLIRHKIHRLPVIDDETGNCLYIITHKRILKFLYLYINDLPKPSIMSKTLRELNIGSYENIETAQPHTLIIEALNKFVERRISALPIVDEEGKLVDIYAKFDVINLAAEGTYSNLDITLQEANEYRNEWFEGVLKCTLDETFDQVMGRIVRAEVHRLVVVDETNKVIGIISLSDILNEMVLKPSASDHSSIRSQLLVTNVEDAMNPKGADSLSSKDSLKRDSLASENTESSSGGELIGDRRVSAPTDSSSAPDPDLDRRVSAPEVKTSQDEDRSRCDNRPVGTATQNPIDDMFNRSMDLPHTEIISMS